jgi:hypothetical protein
MSTPKHGDGTPISDETLKAIKNGCEQSNAGQVTEADFSDHNDDEDDGSSGEYISCPVCQNKCYSDPDTHCKHVVFVVTEDMVNRFNTTPEMDDWLDEKIGTDMCDTISDRKLATFCKKFGIKRDSLTEYGMCCGPVCYEYTFGFKENK